jgi:hypothetical protein
MYPSILQGEIVNIAPNSIRAPEERALQNWTKGMLRVAELRIHVAPNASPNAAPTTEFALTSIQLRVGNNPITEGFVPLPAIVEPIDLSAYADTEDPYLIRFTRPVLLAPGERIMVQVMHTNAAATYFRLTAICEPFTEPGRGVLPWLTFYRTPYRADGGGDFEDASTEADLVNPFDVPLAVDRLVGAVMYNDQRVANAGLKSNSLIYDAIRVRADDQSGTQMVRDPTPFAVLFERNRRAWIVNSTLPPKGFYRFTVESKLSTQLIGGLNVQSFIGMIGYRG